MKARYPDESFAGIPAPGFDPLAGIRGKYDDAGLDMIMVKDTLLEAFRVAIRAPKVGLKQPPEAYYRACCQHLKAVLHDPRLDRRLQLRAGLEKLKRQMGGGLGADDSMRGIVLATVDIALDELPTREKPNPNSKPMSAATQTRRSKRKEQNHFLKLVADTMELDFHELHRLVRFEGLTPGQAAARLVVG